MPARVSTSSTNSNGFGQDNFISFDSSEPSTSISHSHSRSSSDRKRVLSNSNPLNSSSTSVSTSPANSTSSTSNSKGKKRKLDDREETQTNGGPNGWGKAEELKAMARGTPWTRDIEWAACRNAPEMLHRELMAFDAWIQPSFEEHETRLMVIELIRQAIQSQWSDAEIHSFGSQDTKLYLPQGDIDLVILSRSMESQSTPHVLSSLASLLRKHNLATQVQVLAKAKVPIVKFVCNHGKYRVDISLNLTNGITAAKFVNNWLIKEPAIRPIIMFVKHLLDQRGLSEVFTGGLGSYSVILLTISFFQTHPKIQRFEISALRNLGILLIDMLELYGTNYSYEEVGISVNRGGYFRKDARSWDFFAKNYRPFSLSIEDPQDPTNDISKGTYNLQGVRNALAGALKILLNEMARRAIEKQDSLKHRRFRGSKVDEDEEARREILDQNKVINTTGKDPKSLLGTVMGVTREVINQRKNIHDLYHSGTLQHKLNRPSPSLDPQPGPGSSLSSREKALNNAAVDDRRATNSHSSRSQQPPSVPNGMESGNGRVPPSGPKSMRNLVSKSSGYSIIGSASSSRDPNDQVIRQAEMASDIQYPSRKDSRNKFKNGNSVSDPIQIEDEDSILKTTSNGKRGRSIAESIQIETEDDELDSRYRSIEESRSKRSRLEEKNDTLGNGVGITNRRGSQRTREDSYVSHESNTSNSLNGDDDQEGFETISFPTIQGEKKKTSKGSLGSGVRGVQDSEKSRNSKSNGNNGGRKVSAEDRNAFWSKKGNVDPGVDEYDYWATYLDQQDD